MTELYRQSKRQHMMEICELYLKDGSVNYDAVSHNLLLTNSQRASTPRLTLIMTVTYKIN